MNVSRQAVKGEFLRTTIAAVVFCAVSSGAFAATEVSRTHFRDETAKAEYSWVEGCVSRQLSINAAKVIVRHDATSSGNTPALSITYAESNFCDLTSIWQTFWTGSTSMAAVQVDPNLRAARVISASVTLRGIRSSNGQQTDLGTRIVAVAVDWSSDDPIDKYAGTFVTRYPGYYEINYLTGFYRLAKASGTISDGVTNWLANPWNAGLIQLYRLSEGETILVKE